MLESRKDLQEMRKRMARWEEEYPYNGHRILIEFAKRKKAPHAVPWIKEKLAQKDAGILWEVLKDDDELTKKFIDLVPPKGTYERVQTASTAGKAVSYSGAAGAAVGVGLSLFLGPVPLLVGLASGVAGAGGHVAKNEINRKADDHEALKLARKSVEEKILKETKLKTILEKIQKLKPHSAKYVSNLLDGVLQENKEASSSRVHEIIDSLKPYIYGSTPMVKALREAREVFDYNKDINPKVLFILSDGCADEDPTQELQLQDSNVIVVTCYFTSEPVSNPKCLVDEEDPSWSEGAHVLYQMSSTMANTKEPITHLVDYGWKLPLSGESRLFVQANSLDVVEEFCKVAVSHLTHGVDALVHMLGRVSLATYINQSNDDFEAQQQIGATCYANATAAVFHLAMHRIVDREGEIPEFRTIRRRIIREYGKEGANTEMVVAMVCPEYRLRCRKVDENGARQAINERHPVVARFSWKGKQEEMFKEFYERSPKAILNANDIAVKGIIYVVT